MSKDWASFVVVRAVVILTVSFRKIKAKGNQLKNLSPIFSSLL